MLNNKKVLLCALLLFSTLVSKALAFPSDLPTLKNKTIEIFDNKDLIFKQGWYLGLDAGAGLASSTVTTTTSDSPQSSILPGWVSEVNQAGSGTINLNGFTGGIVGGYNWKMNQYLMGFEVDFSTLSSGNTRYFSSSFNPTVPNQPIQNITNTVQTNWLATARYRFGFTFKNLLVYMTEGFAVTQLSNHTIYSIPRNEGSLYLDNNVTGTQLGWTAGLGAEWLFTKKWSFKAECLVASFPSLTSSGESIIVNSADPSQATQTPFNFGANLQLNIMRAGINYHF